MRSLLSKKTKYYKEYAESVFREMRQMRYGISSCKTSLVDDDLAYMRKQIVDWQSNEDEDALCHTSMNLTTFTPVNYRNDALVQFDVTQNAWGPGYYNAQSPVGPQTAGVGITYGANSQNIIEVNSGGCITRINLNHNSSFQFTQVDPSTVWIIQHNMGMKPNVSTEDTTGTDIQGIVEHVDNNLLKIYFNQPVAGKAYLS